MTVPDREELRAVGARLAVEAARFSALGWMRATSGNLSEVLRTEPLLLAVTASGRYLGGRAACGAVSSPTVDDVGAPGAGDDSAVAEPVAGDSGST